MIKDSINKDSDRFLFWKTFRLEDISAWFVRKIYSLELSGRSFEMQELSQYKVLDETLNF